MTPPHPEMCNAESLLGTVAKLACFLPAGHDPGHWDAVDGIWWMTEAEYAALNPA